MRRTLIFMLIIAAGLLAGGVIAAQGDTTAGTSKALGSPGPIILFDRTCHRTVITAPVPARVKFNVLAQQIKCLVRRPDFFRLCVRRLGPPPVPVARFDHGAGNPGDWKGVDKMAAWQAGVYHCSTLRRD